MIPIITLLQHHMHFLAYKDFIEIGGFSILLYYISLWLKKDRQKNLLIYFYSYCALLGTAYVAELSSITFFLVFFAPVICICFIILHETSLQKNYVMLRNTVPAKKEARDWTEQLMRICLNAMNDNTALTCIIEQSDSLRSILTTTIHLDVPLHTGILEMLIKAPTFKPEGFVWLDAHGTIAGINARWKHTADQAFIDDSIKKMDPFKQDALLYTAKTDAIMFRSDPTTHTFDVIAGGTLFESVNAHAVLTSLKTYLGHTHLQSKKGDLHGSIIQQRDQKQHRP